MDQKTMKEMSDGNVFRQRTLAEEFQHARHFMPLKMTRKVYRKFLEDSGVVSELTKVLYKLYDEKEKPPYFNHYFKKYFGETDYDMPNIYWLQQELDAANEKLKKLHQENADLKTQLCRLENYWELKPFDYRY